MRFTFSYNTFSFLLLVPPRQRATLNKRQGSSAIMFPSSSLHRSFFRVPLVESFLYKVDKLFILFYFIFYVWWRRRVGVFSITVGTRWLQCTLSHTHQKTPFFFLVFARNKTRIYVAKIFMSFYVLNHVQLKFAKLIF